MNTLQDIQKKRLIAIIRGFDAEESVQIANALARGGIKLIEVTMNSKKPLQAIEMIKENLGEQLTVGAGTVLDPETAQAAILAGAQFILSPTLNIETIKMTKRYGVVSMPAAMTPTEILTAFEAGGDIIKVFPSSSLGPSYIKDLLGPMPHLKLLPTGGVNLNNVNEYISAGAVGVGIGGSLVHNTNEVNHTYLQEIEKKASRYVSLLNNS